MQNGAKENEIDFQTKQQPMFDFVSSIQYPKNSFVIGANLGPMFSDDYPARITNTFKNYAHVTLRDYSSYCLVSNLSNVQYAPDVIFMAPQPPQTSAQENVVISVIDIARHSNNPNVHASYYALLRDTIIAFTSMNIAVVLVAFCKREGDESAIRHLMDMLPDSSLVSTHFYNGDIRATLSVISNASFVVASRFHSMILGISFGKPIFPISYNCKTENYLNDLNFGGNYATLSTLSETSFSDILYNYKNCIVTDCTYTVNVN